MRTSADSRAHGRGAPPAVPRRAFWGRRTRDRRPARPLRPVGVGGGGTRPSGPFARSSGARSGARAGRSGSGHRGERSRMKAAIARRAIPLSRGTELEVPSGSSRGERARRRPSAPVRDSPGSCMGWETAAEARSSDRRPALRAGRTVPPRGTALALPNSRHDLPRRLGKRPRIERIGRDDRPPDPGRQIRLTEALTQNASTTTRALRWATMGPTCGRQDPRLPRAFEPEVPTPLLRLPIFVRSAGSASPSS